MNEIDLSKLEELSTADLASGMYKKIKFQIDQLTSTLHPNEHILATIDNIAITEIGYHNPNLLIFSGIDSREHRVQKLIHINSLNMNLTVLQNHSSDVPERPIGFLGEVD